ncbi:MAG: diaminopimelate epimerase [Desulfobacteraceae bacterium]|nr:diaminopimelate epimerase [Desulfobacteraceae bacterium]
MMKFIKYHGLGNDYIVINPEEFKEKLDERKIRLICHRNCGVGSDGILLGPVPEKNDRLSVLIYNPDGSEAEKSGNGLRIFARYLYDQGFVSSEKPFKILTKGGEVTAKVMDAGHMVSVEMGIVSFESSQIPVKGESREVINETLQAGGQSLTFCAATIGNPHCVIIQPEISESQTRKLGPEIENHALFPNRTNVQFGKIMDKKNMAVEIWERGAGYTLASGSSASASAAVARKLGLCGNEITVHMPGGKLDIRIQDDYSVFMTGPVTGIAEGTMLPDLLEQKEITRQSP